MKKLISMTVIIGASLLLIWSPNGSATAQKKGTGKSSAAIYQQYCANCHSADGKGRPDFSPDFTNSQWQAKVSDASFLDAINNGRGAMPGFKESLNATEVRALLRHVRAFAKSSGKSVNSGKSAKKKA